MLSWMKPVCTKLKQWEKWKNEQKIPQLEEMLAMRDFTGAMTLLEFQRQEGKGNEDLDMWTGYCAFHLGDYKRSLEVYLSLSQRKGCNPNVWVNLACTYFFLGMYKKSEAAAMRAPRSQLKNRLLFHLAYKGQAISDVQYLLSDENQVMIYHQSMQNILEDHLSLASIHYMRGHFQEALNLYKRILLDDRDLFALNVYVAMCYYKQDYYDVSQSVLALYLQQFPSSTIALNLKACNQFRLYNGKAAEAELKSYLVDRSSSFEFAKELIPHNLVVFRGGEGARRVFPPLIDVIPEARLNLVIYYLRQDDVPEAYNLIADLEPSTTQEYILKGVVNAAFGQEMGLEDHVKTARQCFKIVGSSVTECDTIPGRQCMASYFFLLQKFEDALVFLKSFKLPLIDVAWLGPHCQPERHTVGSAVQYLSSGNGASSSQLVVKRKSLPPIYLSAKYQNCFYNDDTFNFNYAQAKAASKNYKEAEEVFLLIQSETIKSDEVYLTWLARCYIMNQKPRLAWELYLQMASPLESFSLLQVIANDCYKMGQFLYSAKAFSILERLDPSTEYWEGKRGACVGIFQMILAARESKGILRDVLTFLERTDNAQVEYIVRVLKRWGQENHVLD